MSNISANPTKHAQYHLPSGNYDDDEHWAVQRDDGQWEIYSASPHGGRPQSPDYVSKSLPSYFVNFA